MAGAIDHRIEVRAQLIFKFYLKTERRQMVEFLAMMPGEGRCIALGAEHDCSERTKPPIAEHHDPMVAAQAGLFENLVDRRERLDQNAKLVVDGIRKRNQIFVGQPKEFSKRAVAARNPT